MASGTSLPFSRRDFCLGAVTATVGAGGTAPHVVLIVSIKEERLLVAKDPESARRFVAPPGSTLKPLVLSALLGTKVLSPEERYACAGRLRLGTRELNCSHPPIGTPLSVSQVLSYSCNCAVAHFAQRFVGDDLATFLVRQGLNVGTQLLPGTEASGSVRPGLLGAQLQLQALGEEGIGVTPLGLLMAYRRLALRADEPVLAPIVAGLEGAVEFGTAQNARLESIRVAGKTGSVRTESGNRFGWFAGFAPSRKPEVAIAVLVPGRSGGSDAAPLAGKTLRDYFAGRA